MASRARAPKDERESKFLRLGQLQDALLRNARFIVGIEMHTGKMSFDEAGSFFRRKATSQRRRRWWRPSAAPATRLSLLHAGQAGDHEAARRHEEEAGRGISRWRSFTTIFCAGISADQDCARSDAGR
jgi:hypothetical protein